LSAKLAIRPAAGEINAGSGWFHGRSLGISRQKLLIGFGPEPSHSGVLVLDGLLVGSCLVLSFVFARRANTIVCGL
jgi:hypothetical protein